MYGEIAQSKSGGKAILQGLQLQAHSQLSLEVIYRKYDKDYHALYGNAFGEQSNIENEEGVYIGAEFHPYPKWTILAYYDLYEFPGLNIVLARQVAGTIIYLKSNTIPTKKFPFTLDLNKNKNQKIQTMKK